MATTARSKRVFRWAALCGLVLALLAGQVFALGLGRIEVKSRAGQPLLAEIQVVSSDPSELDQLRARLASPETFRRIGLSAPDATVSGLEFTVALDARGQPVIRVTTREPVTQPALTFLVEVDWGQGRLVREYSALVDAPQTVSAPAQPAIEAPAAAPSNTIVRDADAARTGATAAASETDTDEAQSRQASTLDGAADAEDAEDAAAAAAAQPSAPPPTAAAPGTRPAGASPVAGGEYGPVGAGETLGAIAGGLVGDGLTREQAIVALFRANPQAFISDNLNLMRQGAVLRIPARDEIAALDARESRALLREQIAAWREMTQPAPQPGVVADATESPAVAASGASAAQNAGAAGAVANTPAAAADAAPRAAEARLEIVPPSAGDGRQAGTRSGIQSGGEGEMLRQELQQELQQNQETLAARDAEVAELRARVADLERLQAQQAQLLSMKDSEMAAVQERLGDAAGTTAAVPPAGQVRDADAAGGAPWAWIGLGLLAAIVIAWWLLRRAPKATPRPRFDAATLAAASPRRVDGPAETTAALGAPASPAPPAAAPTWHDGDSPAPEPILVDASAAGRDAPAGADAAPVADPDAAMIAALNPAPGGIERIELARAYLDLGDTDTARVLLREVAHAGDPAARAEASRLLEGIA